MKDLDEPVRRPLGQLLVEHGGASDHDVSWALQRQIEGDQRRLGTLLLEEGKAARSAVQNALLAQAKRSAAQGGIRVDAELLDSLVHLVGELVLVRNQLARRVADGHDRVLARTAQRLNAVTNELQTGMMRTRMQPVDRLWGKLPRVVRDLSRACGKRIRLDTIGGGTLLDRNLLEALKDPLIQLVRNAVDHGVEPPSVRHAAGKDPEGVLTLCAHQTGGQVTLEVSDDGAGIDLAQVVRTALGAGHVSAAELSTMDDRELERLVFRPGFSTARAVPTMSGRGVGLDVVRTNIERIGGRVDVESRPGAGTTWRLTIPPTLAVVAALTVECAGERYVLPQAAVAELVFIDGRSTRVELVSGAPAYRLRGRLVPLVRLDQALGLDPAYPAIPTDPADPGNPADPAGVGPGGYVVVLQHAGRRFGLLVDQVRTSEEVVVGTPTGPGTDTASGFGDDDRYAGATILGDGKVALILDVPALARRCPVRG